MTYDLETLRAAVAKATAGEWLLQPTETEGPDYGVGIVADNLGGLVGAALPWPTEVDSGDFLRVEANAAAIVALMNAARAGLLEDAAIARYAAAEITRLRARVAELEAALKQAGQWFHEYGVSHHAKGATEKAERNIERSQFCVNAALKGTAHDPR